MSPDAIVASLTHRLDAARLHTVELFGGQPAGAVVSGLPLLFMPRRKIIAILAGAFGKLRPDGAFYQFTYGPRCPVPRSLLERLGLRSERIGGTLANLPPAFVYRIRRTGVGRSSYAGMARQSGSPHSTNLMTAGNTP